MRKLSKGALWGIGFYLAALTLPAAAAAFAPPSETLLCPDLSQPVETIKDRWGISHIYAKSEGDLFWGDPYGDSIPIHQRSRHSSKYRVARRRGIGTYRPLTSFG
jgi:hypothetical protein